MVVVVETGVEATLGGVANRRTSIAAALLGGRTRGRTARFTTATTTTLLVLVVLVVVVCSA